MRNIGDLLRECPEGTKLYSPIFGVVSLEYVNTDGWIRVIPKRTGILQLFYPDGRFSEDGEVMLFPSDTNRNWDNFVIPFKDGDILATELGSVFILNTDRNDDEHYGCYVGVACNNDYLDINNIFAYKHLCRYADEEEKQKLFKKIKENGYKWDNVTKVLYKIVEPKFKIGDIIKDKCNLKWKVIDVNSHYYEVSLILTDTSKLLEIKAQDDYELVPTIVPKFKVGDRIRNKKTLDAHTIHSIYEDSYCFGLKYIWICDQDDWELAPNKFDINTLVPFESRVLIRDTRSQKWSPAIWGFYDSDQQDYQYKLVGVIARYCIPYEGNEHLLGKIDDCDEFYKNW